MFTGGNQKANMREANMPTRLKDQIVTFRWLIGGRNKGMGSRGGSLIAGQFRGLIV